MQSRMADALVTNLAGVNGVIRVSSQQDRPKALRAREAFLVTKGNLPEGFGVYIAPARDAVVLRGLPSQTKTIVLPDELSYLADGDVLRLWPRKNEIRVLYRRNSFHNHFLLTERCNHYCLMCSQPPKYIDDTWIVDDVLAAIPLIDQTAQEIGFTGGEPTLLGDDFFRILRAMKSYLPRTAIHILSNGRLFAETEFAKRYADIRHFDMMIGIPLYSDVSTIHDYVVQSDGAFDETIRGILNLKRHNQKVEIRVVLHRQTYARLPQLAEFLVRNLTFVDHVALMGLEITGFTRANLDSLWIDPIDYQQELYRAVSFLARTVGCASRSITINYVRWTGAYGPSLASPSAIGKMNTCRSAQTVAKRKTAAASLPPQRFAIATTYGPFHPCEAATAHLPISPSKTLAKFAKQHRPALREGHRCSFG
jgi:His-Xaa-Ser system radical SAM maturase HxsC